MQNEQGKEQKAVKDLRLQELAEEALSCTRDELISDMPYLDRAILQMPVSFYVPEETDEHTVGFGTDGEKLYCIPGVVVQSFHEQGKLCRMYLHSILHCLYCHLFRYAELEPDAWDLASDLAVENVILSLGRHECSIREDSERKIVLDEVKRHVRSMNAEEIYAWLKDHKEEARNVYRHAELFKQDLHVFWNDSDIEGKEYPFKDKVRGYSAKPKTRHQWTQKEQAVEIEVESYEKTMGVTPGEILKKLSLVRTPHQDYGEFLRKFASQSEEVRINQDEFDYIYYTYGMSLYGNMPLIEPLEYCEESRIRDFAIALDTSGSCQGRIVRDFLLKTYDLLKSTDSFFKEMNVHIIQCDSKIQQDIKITSEEEFEQYMKDVDLKGFGGTDFRPVFQYVEQLKEDGEFTDLRGLLYLTDGKGVYPKAVPSFATAFIFLEDGFKAPEVPPWAMRVILAREDLEGE
ncbi:MAG: VWA-like domain-containing protein [Solobacterium sp.]|nr:VWA-like domain-containing protein [Solobacterium sp.]MCH4223110.1 VWA-like domain-containing protein [Solobacterium sp.]MCH4266467.1 VWA-like domain-containing protein [Solobacterium sp.]